MNIFIDLGAYDGDTISQFLNWRSVAFGERDWSIYAFEPNPKYKSALKKYDVIISDKAAWIYDGKIEFAVDKTKTPLGSTIMPGKTAIWDNMPHINVDCFDFSNWLKQFKNDFVIVKMDIEGAEFPVLEKMLSEGTITIPYKLMVEFHANKVKEYTSEYQEDLIKRIKAEGVGLIKWH